MKERGSEGGKECDWDAYVVSSCVAAKDACCQTHEAVIEGGREKKEEKRKRTLEDVRSDTMKTESLVKQQRYVSSYQLVINGQ